MQEIRDDKRHVGLAAALMLLNNERFAVSLFLVILLAVGVAVFDDYGATYDEGYCMDRGRLSWEYVFRGKEGLSSYVYPYHSTLFELPAYGLEMLLGLAGREALLLRHLLIFASFYAGVCLFYLLGRRHLKSWRLSLLSCALLALTPAIFSHAFNNSKDIPFLSASIGGLLTLSLYLERRSAKRALVHAIATAVMIDLRLMGLLMPLLTVLASVTYVRIDRPRRLLALSAIYLSVTAALVVAFWPLLWEDPVGRFGEALRVMSRYEAENVDILFLGQAVKTTELPWYYAPVWILVSAPLAIVAGMILRFASLGVAAARRCRDGVLRCLGLQEALLILWFTLPVAAMWLLGSVSYNGWRHFFYIYPACVLVSVKGLADAAASLVSLGRNGKAVAALLFLLVASDLGGVLWFMAENHPHEGTYLNLLAGRTMAEAAGRFPLTYWGGEYKTAFERILESDGRGGITVSIDANYTPAARLNKILLGEDAKRIRVVGYDPKADYVVLIMEEYNPWRLCIPPGFKASYSLDIRGARIMRVYGRCGREDVCPRKPVCGRLSLP